MAKTPLTARQRGVIRTGAKNVADKYDLSDGGANFKKSARKAITRPGVSAKSKAYRKAIVQATRSETTKKEAKGVKKVLRRADRAGTTKATSGRPKLRALQAKKSR